MYLDESTLSSTIYINTLTLTCSVLDPNREMGTDPGIEENTTKNIRILYYFLNKSLFWLIYMNIKLINDKKKCSFDYHIFEKEFS